MEQRVINILSQIIGAEEGEIQPDLNLFETGLFDSFSIVQLSVELEEQFSVFIPIESLTREEISTPRKIVALIEENL